MGREGGVTPSAGWAVRWLLSAVAVAFAAGCDDSPQEGGNPTLGSTTQTVGADKSAAQLIAGSFYSTEQAASPDGTGVAWRPVVSAEEAACIGERLVDEFGADRALQLGFGDTPWHLRAYALARGPFEREDAVIVVDTFRACSPNWKLLMILSVTEGAERLSDASAECVSNRASDDDAWTLFVGELDSVERADWLEGYKDLVNSGINAYLQCVTPDERAGLDFD